MVNFVLLSVSLCPNPLNFLSVSYGEPPKWIITTRQLEYIHGQAKMNTWFSVKQTLLQLVAGMKWIESVDLFLDITANDTSLEMANLGCGCILI
jgi:hypothetical protein